MNDKKESEPDKQTEIDKLVELVQTLVFTFVIVLVICQVIGCIELCSVRDYIR